MNRQAIFYTTAGVISALTIMTIHRLLFDPEAFRLTPRKKRAVFFGDSITQHGSNVSGWVASMVEWWFRRVDVINRGFSGYNSKWALLIVNEVVVTERPDIVFIFFGANDAVDSSVPQHVPLEDYKSNMEDVIKTLKRRVPRAQLVLITPPPIWEPLLQEFNRQKGKPMLIDRTNERTLSYVNAVKELGTKHQLLVVDAWTSLGGATNNRRDFLSDGLHLNQQGNDKLFAAIQAVLQKEAPEWTPDLLRMHMPEWSEMVAAEKKLAGK